MEKSTVTFSVVKVVPDEKAKHPRDFCEKCCFAADAGYICCAPNALVAGECSNDYYYEDID